MKIKRAKKMDRITKNVLMPCIVVVGSTASGKSALAVQLAKKFNGEVISADSRQVYRGLDIGTGKITKREMRSIPHHLLDVVSPQRIFAAHDFFIHARAVIRDTTQRGKLPIVCGGTGFYIDALFGRIALPDVPPNQTLRTQLEKKSESELFALLKKRDLDRARQMNKSDKKNKRRLIRALEITLAKTKVRPLSTKVGPLYETLWIGITWPKEVLKRRIRARLIARIRHGMLAEAKSLHARGLSYKRMETFGLEYRFLSRLLQKKISRAAMLTELERAINQYAKRQLTYWKRNKEITWFSPQDTPRIERAIQTFLSK